MKVLKRTNRFYDTSRFGQPQIRVYHKNGVGKRMPRYLLKCGCCDERVEIHYADDGLEIGGVNGTIEDWREILLPLLLIEQHGSGSWISGRQRPTQPPRKTHQATLVPRKSELSAERCRTFIDIAFHR